NDPIAFMSRLETRFADQRPGKRFHALEVQLAVRKKLGEKLMELYDRIHVLSYERKRLRPSTFTLQELDDDIDIFCLLRALPEEYGPLRTSI
ncbi:hypothetical protein EXIGLDRAFT_592249, partial [Exidia glandulosa HHB12029]